MRRVLFSLITIIAFILVLSIGVLSPLQAAEYPQKSITLIVPHPPGGSTDTAGRVLAEKLRAHLGQTVVIVNKTSPQVGLNDVLQARADGYTLGYVHHNYLTLTPLLTNLPFKGPQDMSIIATGHLCYSMLGVSPESGWKTARDLLVASRAAQGKIRASGSGVGSLNHLTILEFNEKGKGQLTYVPFSGGSGSITSFLGGHVESFVGTPEIRPHIDAGKVRVLGIFGPKRLEVLPDVPTMKEQGLDIDYPLIGVLFGPKALPDKLKYTLEQAVKKVLQDPGYINIIQKQQGFEVSFVSSDDLTKQMAADHAKMKVVMERYNLKSFVQ